MPRINYKLSVDDLMCYLNHWSISLLCDFNPTTEYASVVVVDPLLPDYWASLLKRAPIAGGRRMLVFLCIKCDSTSIYVLLLQAVPYKYPLIPGWGGAI